MAGQKHPAPVTEIDLETTAELPLIEFSEGEGADDEQLPASLAGAQFTATTDQVPAIPAGVADLADSLREVEQRLQRKIERLGQLETELMEARLRIQEQNAQLGDLRQQSEQRTAAHRDQQEDLSELRRRSTRLHEALSTWQGFRNFSESMLAESEARSHGLYADHAAALLEAQAVSSRLRDEMTAAEASATAKIAELAQSLEQSRQAEQDTAAQLRAATERSVELSAALAASNSELVAAQQQIEALRAGEDQARAAMEMRDEQQRQIAALEAEVAAAAQRQQEVEDQLRQASERSLQLEGEARASAAAVEGLQRDMQRLSHDDTGSRQAPRPAAGSLVLRVLIRQDGGSEVVYPIGRRTTIGRTRENDIQVDASFISRHHAVLLSSADHCIVEDLNSTNGVLVNGRRVSRQKLRDGDAVTVGKTEFRYQQRS